MTSVGSRQLQDRTSVEERFDYDLEDTDHDEKGLWPRASKRGHKDKMLGLRIQESPLKILTSFDTASCKKNALLLAKAIDEGRGMVINEASERENIEEGDSPSSQRALRRLPSGTRPPSATNYNIRSNETTTTSTPLKRTDNRPIEDKNIVLKQNDTKRPSSNLSLEQSTPLVDTLLHGVKPKTADTKASDAELGQFDLLQEAKLLNEERKSLQEDIIRTQKTISEKDNEINKLQIILQEKDNSLKETLDLNNKQIQELRKIIETLENEKSTYMQQLNDHKSEMNSLQTQNGKLSTKNEQLEICQSDAKETIIHLQSSNQDKNKELEELKASRLTLKQELDLELKEQKNAYNNMLSQKNNQINEAEAELDKVRILNKALSAENQKLLEELDTVRAHFKDATKQKEEQQSAMEKLKESLLESEKSCQKLQLTVDENTITLTKNVKLLSDLEKKLDSIMDEKCSIEKRWNETETNMTQLQSFMRNIRLFDINLGTAIRHAFNEDDFGPLELSKYFTQKFSNLKGFYKTEHDEKASEYKQKIASLEKSIKELKKTNESWMGQLDDYTYKLKLSEETIVKLRTQISQLESKLEQITQKNDNLQLEKNDLIKQREKILQSEVQLNEEVSKLRSQALDKQENKFIDLTKEVKRLTEETNKKQKNIVNLSEGIQKKTFEITKLQNQLDSQANTLRQLSSSLKKLEGNNSQRITFDVAHKSHPQIDQEMYNWLMVERVDKFDMVQLQNIVKNLILSLEIPFNKLSKKIPLIVIYLKYEKPLLTYFANRVHYRIFGEPIDMKALTNAIYTQYLDSHNMNKLSHPLDACLNNLYDKLNAKI